MSDNFFELVENLFCKHGISPLSTYLIIKKIELTSMNTLEHCLVQVEKAHDLNTRSMSQMIASYLTKYKKTFATDRLVGEKLSNELNRILKEKLPPGATLKSTDSRSLEIFSFNLKPDDITETKVKPSVKNFKTSDYSMKSLNKVKEQINQIKSRNKRKMSESMEINENVIEHAGEIEGDTQSVRGTSSLISLIHESTNQNLETNLDRKLKEMSSVNESLMALTESILFYENKKIRVDQQQLLNNSHHLNRSMSSRSSRISKNRCVVDILLDYFCHLDPQIINKEFMLEHRLLFELRGGISSETYAVEPQDMQLVVKKHLTTSAITQSFLLSLFIHQASWEKLYTCAQYLLDNHSFFSKSELDY